MQNISSAKNSGEKSEDRERGDLVATAVVSARRRMRFFQPADSWFNRLVRLATAVHEGFWLGCLSVDELNAITAKHYGQSQESISPEGNLRGFFDWERRAVERYFPPGSYVWWRELAEEEKSWRFGAQVTPRRVLRAIRCSSSQQHDLRSAWRSARRYVLSPDQGPSGPSLYRAIIVGWTAYSHIPTRARRVAFLRALRQCAVAGSPILLSFLARMENSPYDALTLQIANWTRRLLRGGKEPVELGDHLNWSYSHWFTREEIESELREATIRPVHFGEVGEGYLVGIVERSDSPEPSA